MSSDVIRSILAASPYMTLATADAHGVPWACPVWYATVDYREFVWASKQGARHSRNLEQRPDLAIVIFDSRQPPGTGEEGTGPRSRLDAVTTVTDRVEGRRMCVSRRC